MSCVDTIIKRAHDVRRRADEALSAGDLGAGVDLMHEVTTLRVLLREPQCHLPECDCNKPEVMNVTL